MSDKTTHFITDYKPDMSACVELTNGKFFDVINGNYFESGTRVFITNGKIQSVTETERVNSNDHRKADFSINLQGRTVLPGLFNTHCHPSAGKTRRD